jgi:hypothetical protein
MAKFVLGLVCGLALGLTATAAAANIVGLDSFLSGWDVTKKGDLVCKDPWVDVAHNRLECS